jgi:7,8-dihydropterin-6-yl-methyl-4-(beta-D-ribofuranosyl)aminobenzene 5'-phosphate synthase
VIKSLKMRVLVEDTTSTEARNLIAQHGLSLLVEAQKGNTTVSVLMDTGPSSEAISHNTKTMKFELRRLDAIVLSHGHYDHLGGLLEVLRSLNERVPVIAHPKAFSPKIASEPKIRLVGSPFKIQEIEAVGGVPLLASNSLEIAGGVLTSGEIKRETEYEEVEGFLTIEDGKFVEDKMLDDQALIIDLEDKGLVVVTGCAHSGVVNTLRHAQRITSTDRVYAIVGGFHLSNAKEDRIGRTVDDLIKFDPEMIAPCHCTGIGAVKRLMGAFGGRCKPVQTGDTIYL